MDAIEREGREAGRYFFDVGEAASKFAGWTLTRGQGEVATHAVWSMRQFRNAIPVQAAAERLCSKVWAGLFNEADPYP